MAEPVEVPCLTLEALPDGESGAPVDVRSPTCHGRWCQLLCSAFGDPKVDDSVLDAAFGFDGLGVICITGDQEKSVAR